ncbi:unnamed protein product, partial [Rotaria sordida]
MAESFAKIQMIEGIPVSAHCNAETFRSALKYKGQPDDIFLVVYPKSGTTWMQVILYTLMNDGKAFDNSMAEYFARTPFLELIGERGMKNMHRPCVIKTHLPFNRVPYNENAKYICVVRNPKDVCVSFYYFLLKINGIQPNQMLFDTFFEAFINGNVPVGDYFEHLHSIWQHKNDTNVFLTSFEEMKRDLPEVIRRVAQFMNIELSDNLVECIASYSSFNYMKERFDKAYTAQASVALANEGPDEPWPVDKIVLQRPDHSILVREGAIGNWSSTMSEEQAQRLDKIFA